MQDMMEKIFIVGWFRMHTVMGVVRSVAEFYENLVVCIMYKYRVNRANG